MSTERKRVALMVDPETKEKWHTAVEESNEYSTLSGLIRHAVEAELSGAGNNVGGAEPAQIDSEAFGDITDSLRRIEGKIDDLDSRVSSLEGDTASTEDALTKTKIFSALGSSDEAMTAERLAQHIGFPLEQVQEQLDQLEDVTGMLESWDGHDGKTRYHVEADA